MLSLLVVYLKLAVSYCGEIFHCPEFSICSSVHPLTYSLVDEPCLSLIYTIEMVHFLTEFGVEKMKGKTCCVLAAAGYKICKAPFLPWNRELLTAGCRGQRPANLMLPSNSGLTPGHSFRCTLCLAFPLLISPLNPYQTLTNCLPFSGALHLLGQPGVLFGTREFLARDCMCSCCGAEGAPCSHSPGRKRFASQPQRIM